MSAADCLAILLCVLIVAAIALAGRPRRPPSPPALAARVPLPDACCSRAPSRGRRPADWNDRARIWPLVAGAGPEASASAVAWSMDEAQPCGCSESYPQLIPGRLSHGPGCAYREVRR